MSSKFKRSWVYCKSKTTDPTKIYQLRPLTSASSALVEGAVGNHGTYFGFRLSDIRS